MKVVAVLGTTGGAGATTVVAHLAAALAAQQRPVLAFDFCPENVLRLHFAMPWSDRNGLAPLTLDNRPWHEAGYRSAGGVDFVPFGQLDSEAALHRYIAFLAEHPGWFAERLKELLLPPGTLVLCDCPRFPAALREQALAVAAAMLVVATPDPVAYAAATQIIDSNQMNGGPAASIVLNNFDPARSLDRDIAVLLRTGCAHRLASVQIHRDESLREALASKQTVFDFAPSSQAAYEFSALATWLVAHLGQLQSAS